MKKAKVFYEVQEILNTRKKPSQVAQYLVKWKNYPQSQSTWEPITNLENAMDIVLEYQMTHNKNTKLPSSQITQLEEYCNKNRTRKTSSSYIGNQLKKRKCNPQILQKSKTKEVEQVISNQSQYQQQPVKPVQNTKIIEKQKKTKEVEKIFYKAMSQKGDHLYCVIYKNDPRIYLSSQEIRKKHPQEFIDFLEQDFLSKLIN